jgi:hypothetical protein
MHLVTARRNSLLIAGAKRNGHKCIFPWDIGGHDGPLFLCQTRSTSSMHVRVIGASLHLCHLGNCMTLGEGIL